MKANIYRFIGVVLYTSLLAPLFSRPFLKIQKVDSSNYPYISAEVLVSNVTPIENLDETNFSIYENEWKVGFFHVKKIEPETHQKNIALLIDASYSLSKEKFNHQIEAVKGFVRSLHPNDRVAIISFSDNVKVHCAFTSSRDQLKSCIEGIHQSGKTTRLYDAISKGVQITLNTHYKRTYMILFSDGMEDGSETSSAAIKRLVSETRIPLFVVGTGEKNQLKHLIPLTVLSGGETYHTAGMDSIGKIYLLLNHLLDNVYIVKYLSQADSSFRDKNARLEIRLSANDLKDQDTTQYQYSASLYNNLIRVVNPDERIILFGSGALLVMILSFIAGRISKRRSPSPAPIKEIQSANIQTKTRAEVQEEPQATEIREIIPRETEEPDTVIYDPFPEPVTEEIDKPRAEERIISQRSLLPENYRFGYLLVKEGTEPGRQYSIDRSEVTIGHGNENTIVLNDPLVSYNHAKIEHKNGNFYLFDLVSEYGVYLNTRKLLRPRSLNDFDQIEIGGTLFLFRRAAG